MLSECWKARRLTAHTMTQTKNTIIKTFHKKSVVGYFSNQVSCLCSEVSFYKEKTTQEILIEHCWVQRLHQDQMELELLLDL